MFTTAPVFRECMGVLMEQEPKGVDSSAFRTELEKIDGVHSIDDLHIWSLAGGKNVMTVHVFL